jgi:hypothetical protein
MTSISSYHNPVQNERPDEELVGQDLRTRSYPLEVRIPNMRQGYFRTLSGFFDNPDDAMAAVLSFTGAHAPGVYATFNPLKDHVFNWNHNILGKSVVSAGDVDVAGITGLYLDIDPVRPRLTCATNAEQRAARARGNEIAHYLMTDLGFPLPVWAGLSGSGATARWRVDLPIEDATLIARCLAALDAMFTDNEVKVDAGVGNPARISRIAGTINAKSPTPQPDRPWRMASGKAFETQLVTREQLEELAALAPPEEDRSFKADGSSSGPAYNLKQLLQDAGIEFTEKARSYQGGGATVYEIASCLTSDEHDSGAAFIQFASGAVAYRCLHDSCSTRSWQDVKPLLGIRPASSMNRTAKGKTFTPIKIGANGRVAS